MASIRIHDPEEYQKYLDRSGEIFNRFKGEYLAVDKHPEVLEGDWDYGRAVLIRFDTREDFNAWYRSESYGEILKHRISAAECDTILIRGD